MWIITAKRELINSDQLSKIVIEGSKVVGLSGSEKQLLHDAGNPGDAADLFKAITEKLGAGARSCDAESVLRSVIGDRQRAKDAQENAKRVQAEAKARQEAAAKAAEEKKAK